MDRPAVAEVRVVVYDENAVGGGVDVYFHALRTKLERAKNCGHGILRKTGVRSAMGYRKWAA